MAKYSLPTSWSIYDCPKTPVFSICFPNHAVWYCSVGNHCLDEPGSFRVNFEFRVFHYQRNRHVQLDPIKSARVFALPPGVRGDSEFVDNNTRRLWLARWWGTPQCPTTGFWLWIGMNPSKAGSNVDDPTVAKETLITKRHGGSAYIKCNVMDWIETDSHTVSQISKPCSSLNHSVIMNRAFAADKIVCAWGLLHHTLKPFAIRIQDSLLRQRYELWCLGTTKDGSPKHPLYLKATTKIIRYLPGG